MNPIHTKRFNIETKIQEALEKFLTAKGWLVKSTHGNMFQYGFPDIYAAHIQYGARWIEVKNPTGYSFTRAQLDFFPKLEAVGVGVWILTTVSDKEYLKLFHPANWREFLGRSKI